MKHLKATLAILEGQCDAIPVSFILDRIDQLPAIEKALSQLSQDDKIEYAIGGEGYSERDFKAIIDGYHRKYPALKEAKVAQFLNAAFKAANGGR
jgi:hypothetical protein